ncbi:MAG: hypothetical protein RLZZ207_1160 [Bacteroidota bacterium]
MDLKSSTQEKSRRYTLRKKWARRVGFLLLALLTLEFTVYFGSNLFLSRMLRERLQESSNGVYEIDFNRLNFSLIRRGVFLDGITFTPQHPEKARPDQKLFEFTLDELAFTGLWFNFFKQELSVRKITLDNPNIHLLQPLSTASRSAGNPSEVNSPSPVFLLENEIKRSVRKLGLSSIQVAALEINQANLFFLNFLSQQGLITKNASLKLVDLDWTPLEDWVRPFNARGFEIELEEVSFPLPDGIHRITSAKVQISSLEKTMDFNQFFLSPNLSKPSKNYYKLALEEQHIGNIDWNKAFRTGRLDIEELILKAPQIEVIQSSRPQDDKTPAGDLNDFIRGKLESVSIKELSINGGSFLKKEKLDSLRNRIELEHLDFKMIGFHLGSTLPKTPDSFFYGTDASMKIKKGKIYLGDGVHVLAGEAIEVSSFKKILSITNLHLSPKGKRPLGIASSPVVDLELTELSLENADLKHLYQTGELQVGKVFLNRPKIEIIQQDSKTKQAPEQVLTSLFSGLFDKVEIGDFQLEEGTVEFKLESGQKSKDIGVERFSLGLQELVLLPDSSLALQNQVQLKELQLTLHDYRLNLRDNLHTFLAEQLTLDSKRKLLEVKNLRILPADPSQLRSQLQALDKRAAVDFTIPQLRAEGIDLMAAIYSKELSIQHLQLDAPLFRISTYRPKESKISENALRSEEDLRALLLGYFTKIQVDSVDIDAAKLRYDNQATASVTSFEEDRLSFSLTNFSLSDKDSLPQDRALFSDEVKLTITSYSFNLAGGRYLVETDYLNYNSSTRTLDFENLNLLPGKAGDKRIALGLRLPKLTLKGVNIEEFVFDNVLNLEKLEINGGDVVLDIDRQITAVDQKTITKRKKAVQKAIEEVYVDTIAATNATLQLNYQSQDQTKQAIKTGFAFHLTQFNLDSLLAKAQDYANMYERANLSLSDFTYTLPDSVHTVKFATVAFGDQSEEVVFSGLSIQPIDLFGKLGSPVVRGTIEQLILQKNSLLDLLLSRKLDLKQVHLVRPQLAIFLDSLPPPPGSRNPNSEKKEIPLIQSIGLEGLSMENGQLDLYQKGGQALPNGHFPRVDFTLSQLGIDLLDLQQLPSWKELLLKNMTFSLSDYEAYTQDSSYRVRLDKLHFAKQNLSLDGIYYRPVLGTDAYLSSLPFQTEAITADIKQVRLEGIDLLRLASEDQVIAKLMVVDGASLELVRDKRKPLDSLSYKPMPQYLLEHAKINADLDSVQVTDSQVGYVEFGEKSSHPGAITFDQLRIDVGPIFLRKQGAPYPVSEVKFGMAAQIGDSSRIGVRGQMYFEKGYPMKVQATANKLAFAEVSDLVSKTAFVRPISGEITQANWDFEVNEQEAFGSMTLGYRDLKLQFIDSLTLTPGKGKLRIYSLLANLLAKNSNPRSARGTPVVREIYIKRDRRKSLINAWWKATFSGLKATLGFGRAKMPKHLRKEMDE